MWLASIIADKPMVEKLCKVIISAKLKHSINWPFILSHDCSICKPPLLGNVFQKDTDSDTEAL